jgi:integrase
VHSTYRGRDTTKDYENTTFAEADDYSDANAVTVLTFDQAQAKARAMRTARVSGVVSGKYTVREAVADYVEFLRVRGKEYRRTEKRAASRILPDLGDVEVGALTSAQLRHWHDRVAHSGKPLRTRVGDAPRFQPIGNEDAARARKTTANRLLTILKAALNHAYDEKRVASNDAWGRRVKPFVGVTSARLRYLTVAEAKRLINAAEPTLRDLCQVALQTGCRLGEINRLIVSDFNRDSGTVFVQKSKSGKARHVVLTDEGVAVFDALCAGRRGDDRLLREWRHTPLRDAMQAAIARAHIDPIPFHGLRHTWASLAVMNGVPLQIVAQNLGHSDTRMVERHYGHMSRSHVVDVIRAGAPRFGLARTNVRRLP